MRVCIRESQSGTILYIMADEISYDYDENKINIISNQGAEYCSINQIKYEDYIKLTANVLSYGFLDLSNILFNYYCC